MEEQKITPKQQNFIECYVKCLGNISKACEMMKIHRVTFYKWEKENETFAKLCREELSDYFKGFVEGKMYQRIAGMDIKETIEEYDADGNLMGYKKIKKQLPPSEKLIQFWLEKRLKSEYGVKQIDVTSGGEKVQQIYVLPDGTEITFP
jgi:hypothetical protein